MKLLCESLPLCGKPYVEMIAVMARYNPFAEHAGMTRICESIPDKSIIATVSKLEKLDFTSYLLAVPEYNIQKLDGKVDKLREILSIFKYPYNRRIAGAHGRFITKDYRYWLQNTERHELVRALSHLTQLNQPKVYLFWKNDNFR